VGVTLKLGCNVNFRQEVSPQIKKRKYLLLAGLVLLGCRLGGLGQPSTPLPRVSETVPTQAQDEAWYSIYFTDPQSAASESLRGGPDQSLAEAIRQARLSVDVAVLRLDLWSLRDALIAADRRGASVRVVTDNEYFDEREVQDLIAAGIPVVKDGSNGLMHNKFTVIDRQEVWTGSMNMTVGDAYRNNNNLLHIHSALLAENYTREFEEMAVDHQFGQGSPADTPHPALAVDGTQLENYFSPDDGVAARLVELIQSARESVKFMAYSFTSDELAEALIERKQAGLAVSGLMDAEQAGSNAGEQYNRFISAGMDVRLDGNPGAMHHKVLVIDRRIVVTGSYNFTISAETRNDENILIIDDRLLAEAYLAEFDRLYAQAESG
jgi:phosphatidylserine/phosphatidylglycerophosphate/cardiolipin synthase-like enzyme